MTKGVSFHRDSCSRIVLACVVPTIKPPLATEEVPDHDDSGGKELGEGDLKGTLAQKCRATPHTQLVDDQSDGGKDAENHEFAPPTDVCTMREDIAH